MAARLAAASACVLLATLLPAARSLVLSGGDVDADADLDWDEWMQMSSHKPQWFDSWSKATRNTTKQSQMQLREAGPKLRVAVFCSGVLKRFFLQETASGLVAPMVKEGHEVDYYAALNMGDFHSYHPGADSLAQDPRFADATEGKVRGMITSAIEKAGAKVRKVDLFARVDIQDQPNERHWLNTPGNNMLAKWNVLKKLKPLQALYEQAEAVEKEKGKPYDFMIFLDDDTVWLEPFSLSSLLRKTKQHKENQLFTLFCGKGSTTVTPDEGFLTEYIFVANRSVAHGLGKQYDLITSSGLGRNVFNLEQFSYRVASRIGADIVQVPLSGIPMQRVGRKIKKNGTMIMCLHKKCMDWPEGPEGFTRMNPMDYYPICNEALWKKR